MQIFSFVINLSSSKESIKNCITGFVSLLLSNFPPQFKKKKKKNEGKLKKKKKERGNRGYEGREKNEPI